MIVIRRLIWNDWNIDHIARHKVTPDEVEEVCHGDTIQWETYAGRLMIIGMTIADRCLAVVLAPRGKGLYFPVTARPADHKEKRLYKERQRKDNSND